MKTIVLKCHLLSIKSYYYTTLIMLPKLFLKSHLSGRNFGSAESNYMECLMEFQESLTLFYTKISFKILKFSVGPTVFFPSNLLYMAAIYVLFICKTKSRLRRRHCGLARHFKTDPTETVALCFGYAKTLQLTMKALWPGASFQNRSY
jgi:hypothetical protein